MNTVWRRLLGVERAVIERVEFDEEEGVLVASVRPKRRERGRCGICRRKCPRYDAGDGRRRWRTLDLGSSSGGEIVFYVLEPHFWTASREFAESCVRNGYRLVGERRIPSLTLGRDLRTPCSDAEDRSPLRGHRRLGPGRSPQRRLGAFRPRVVVAETNIVGRPHVRAFLEPLGYKYHSSTGHETNSVFVDSVAFESSGHQIRDTAGPQAPSLVNFLEIVATEPLAGG